MWLDIWISIYAIQSTQSFIASYGHFEMYYTTEVIANFSYCLVYIKYFIPYRISNLMASGVRLPYPLFRNILKTDVLKHF